MSELYQIDKYMDEIINILESEQDITKKRELIY